MNYLNLVPAYGRDYGSQAAVKADWEAGMDFCISDVFSPDDGRYVNKPQLPEGTRVLIRYKAMRRVVAITVT